MRVYITMITLVLFSMAQPAQAAALCAPEAPTVIHVKVNGLVCDFCARALEKVFGKRDEVSAIAVDLDNGKVDIHLKPGKHLDDALISELIGDSGYNITAIEREC